MTNVAAMTVSLLSQAGVKRIYGLIGDSLNTLGEAIRQNKKIEWVSVRHEESAAFAAGSEAFLTGELCVCAGTCGPGSIHLINGLYEANRNEVPVLAIVSHIPSNEIGLQYFQETDPLIAFRDCSVFCEAIMNPRQMPRVLQEAMQTAISQKGVAVIVIPSDIMQATVPLEQSVYTRVVDRKAAILNPNPTDIQKLANIIDSHSRITLYCGVGCRHAKDEVLALSEKIKAPIVHTIRSKEFMQSDNPNDVGLNGYLSMGEPKEALDSCDLLVLLGTDFPFEMILPTTPDVVQIDSKASHLGRRSKLTFGLKSGVKPALQALLPLIKDKKDDNHLRASIKHKNQIYEHKMGELEEYSTQTPLRPEYLTHVLNTIAPDNAVFIVDVGLNDVWAARYLDALGSRRIFGSFKHGTMAAATPDGIGAFYALPKGTPIIVLAGDGGLTMLMGELLTIIQHDIDIKIIVYNNGELGYINFEAEMERIPPFKTELKNPNFAKMAEVIGFKGFHIDDPNDLKSVLQKALNETGPVLIDAVTDPAALP